jgi:hypothetical protein
MEFAMGSDGYEYRLAPFKAWWRETNCGLGERMAVIVAFL